MYKYKPRHDYRAKCLGIVTLRVLSTTCFRYNSEEISSKFPILKMKLTTTEISTREPSLKSNTNQIQVKAIQREIKYNKAAARKILKQ